ncbi:MAG: hypothetical protein ABF491_08410 [Acetobacter sp.]|uniref:hypothetical protein n=1 Tax=Acetobacter sp. TaxID=440 RepID=UPI0039EC5864
MAPLLSCMLAAQTDAIILHQPSAISHQPSAISHQPSANTLFLATPAADMRRHGKSGLWRVNYVWPLITRAVNTGNVQAVSRIYTAFGVKCPHISRLDGHFGRSISGEMPLFLLHCPSNGP